MSMKKIIRLQRMFNRCTGHITLELFFMPSFARPMEAATTMLIEDAALFTTMFEANPHSLEAGHMFRFYLNVAAGGNLSLLSQKALWWWRRQHKPGEPAS